MMITREQMLPFLVEVCPSFLPAWRGMKAEQNGAERLHYIELGSFARHIVELQLQGQNNEFAKVFEVIERLHVEGDNYVQEAVTIGLLENIQNIASNRQMNPDLFVAYLRPVSKTWWVALNKFWDGEADTVSLSDS